MLIGTKVSVCARHIRVRVPLRQLAVYRLIFGRHGGDLIVKKPTLIPFLDPCQ